MFLMKYSLLFVVNINIRLLWLLNLHILFQKFEQIMVNLALDSRSENLESV